MQSTKYQPQYNRTNNYLSICSATHKARVRKQSPERSRSVSTTQAGRLWQLATDSSNNSSDIGTRSSGDRSWITPEHSPHSAVALPQPALEILSSCSSLPTPPRSDGGVSRLSFDGPDQSTTCASSEALGFQLHLPMTSAEMRYGDGANVSGLANVHHSSLELLLPSQYGATLYESEPTSKPYAHHLLMSLKLTGNDPAYAMDVPPDRSTQSTSAGDWSAYAETAPISYRSDTGPAYPFSRQQHDLSMSQSQMQMAQNFRRISSPYEASSLPFTGTTNQSIPSISGITQSPIPSPNIMNTSSAASTSASPYSSSLSRSPNLYGSTSLYQQTSYSTSPAPFLPNQPQSLSYPPSLIENSVSELIAKDPPSNERVLNSRPKPQCWEHGCNGRQFSTFSNLLRHQREKSGTAPKSYCPKCGAEFTRTTARNGHLQHDKCTKGQPQRRLSEDQQ